MIPDQELNPPIDLQPLAASPRPSAPDNPTLRPDAPIASAAPFSPTMALAMAPWDSATKRTVWVILLSVAVFVLWISYSILGLLIFAGMIAYLLNPLVDLAERLRVPRGVTTITLFILLLIGIVLLPIVLTPILIQQLTALSRFDVTRTAFDLFNWFNATVRNLPETVTLFGFQIIIAPFTRQIEANFRQMSFIPTVSEILAYVQQLLSTATTLVSTTAVFGFNVVGGIFQVLFRILVVFFLSLYLTKDLPSIRHYVEELFPKSYQPELREVFRRMGAIWHAFFRGQIALCTVVGISTWLALTVAGMPGALVLGIIAGVMEIIPSIGPTLATVPAVLVALTQGSTVLDAYGISNIGFALITVGIYFIIQQVETSILIPRIIGGSVSLHPVVVICGVAVGLNVAGILGAFLAAPLIATLRVLGSYLHAKLLDYPPFQEPTPEHRRRSRYRHTVSGEATPPKHTNPEELLVVEQRASVPSAEAQA